MLYFNLILTLICFWLIFRINSLFIQPARWNRYRFRLFELRDNLALLAMRGEIEEQSDEYITLMSMLNKAVNETSKFKAVKFLRFLIEIKKNKELQQKLNDIVSKMSSENKEYQAILHGYFETVHKMFKDQTKSFYWFVPPLIFMLGCCHILNNMVLVLKSRLDVIDTLDNDIQEKKEKTFCPAAA